MNNEPVAYGKYIENAKMWLVVELDADMPEGYIPLYTHPAKESKAKDRFSNYESICLQCGTTIYKSAFKTLTDEEILATIKEFQEEQSPPYKGYENTYIDGWTDACNEIYSAIFELLEGKK
jgi:hypothetical protein